MDAVSVSQAVDVERVRLDMLRYARAHGIDSAVLMQAMAEVMGMTAHVLDREVGMQRFDERMAVVCEHARAWYLRGPRK